MKTLSELKLLILEKGRPENILRVAPHIKIRVRLLMQVRESHIQEIGRLQGLSPRPKAQRTIIKSLIEVFGHLLAPELGKDGHGLVSGAADKEALGKGGHEVVAVGDALHVVDVGRDLLDVLCLQVLLEAGRRKEVVVVHHGRVGRDQAQTQ